MKKLTTISLSIPFILLLASCGGSSDDSSGTTTDNSSGTPTEDLSTTDNLVIRQSAAENALDSLSRSLSNTSKLSDSEIPVLDTPTLDTVTGDSLTGMQGNQQTADEFNTDSDSLLKTSLGLDENSNAKVTKSGNTITINPDDADLCREELAQTVESTPEMQDCLVLVKDVLLRIEASTEESGTISYLFQDETVLAIDYEPTSSAFEISLDGLKTYLTAAAALEEFPPAIPSVFTGALRFSTSFIPQSVEAGTLAVNVTRPVQVINEDGNLNMQPGELIAVETVEGTGNGVMTMDVGAISWVTVDSFDQSTEEFNLPGLTARMDLSNNGNALKVTNFGLARGPITVTVDSVEDVRLSMNAFGFTINEADGELVLDTNLDISQFVRYEAYEGLVFNGTVIIEPEPESTSQLTASAPAGTGFLSQLASTKVTRGGPFNISLVDTETGADPVTSSASVAAGQCYGNDGNESNGSLDIVPCDP